MAGQSRIIGRIASITYSTSLTEDEAEFLVQYRCSGLVSGQFFGEVVLVCDITQADAPLRGSGGIPGCSAGPRALIVSRSLPARTPTRRASSLRSSRYYERTWSRSTRRNPLRSATSCCSAADPSRRGDLPLW